MSSVRADPPYGWVSVTANAAFVGRDGAGLLVLPDTDGVQKLWLIGGWNPNDTVHFTQHNPGKPGCCTTSEVWRSADGINWSLVKANTPGSQWQERHMGGWTVFNGKMWIVGGDDNSGNYQTDVWNSTDGANWTKSTGAAPWATSGQNQPGRVLHYVVAYNGKLWVMGGQALPAVISPLPNPYPTQLYLYSDIWNSSDGQTWTQVKKSDGNPAAMPQPMGIIAGSVVFDNQMWVIGGGIYGDDNIGDPYCDSKCASKDVMPGGCPKLPTNGEYVCGVPYNEVWSSADGATWVQHASPPWDPRRYHSIAVFDNRIWVLAGDSWDGAATWYSDVWYSSDGENWSAVPGTPWAAVHAQSVVAFNGALWMTAGTTMTGQPTYVWKLGPNLNRLVPVVNSALLTY